MAAARKFYKKKPVTRCINADSGIMSPVVTVRISDEEKERIDQIMKQLNITRYSDVMRMALYQFHIKALSSLVRLRLLNIRSVCLRRLNPHRLDFIFDLKLE